MERIVGLSTFDVVDDVSYLPFGPVTQIDFSDSGNLDFAYDANYAIDAVGGAFLALDLEVNEIGNIVGLDAASAADERVYSYDPLSRLSEARDGNAALIEGFTYDGTGNRLTKQSSASTQNYGYPSSSHRLTSVDATTRSYDAMGSLTDRGDGWTFEYDPRQRLKVVKHGGSTKQTNQYNGKGERVSKTYGTGMGGGNTLYFVYDESGRLLAEYLNGGTSLQKEYIWLDDRPVAVRVHQGAYAGETLTIHSDHLGTPRAIVVPHDEDVVWRWDFEVSAFGEHSAAQDPDGDRTNFEFNLRYAGQYFDKESGLHQNGYRDYEAATGRYVESDPIGLKGGAATFSYVMGRPLILTDSLGLKIDIDRNCSEKGCDDEWYRNLEAEIKQSCIEDVPKITDVSLRNCLEERCRSGKVKVNCLGRDRGEYTCPKDRGPKMPQDPDWVVTYYRTRSGPISGSGRTVVHEWAHSCNWGHVDRVGVPRTPDRVDPDLTVNKRCLPGMPLGTTP